MGKIFVKKASNAMVTLLTGLAELGKGASYALKH